MRHLIILITMVLSHLAAMAEYAIADIPNVHLQDSTKFVSNPAGVLSDQAVAQIDERLRSTMRNTTAEVVVVVIDSADTDDLDGFATDLFTKWGIGKKDKDNGLLVLISRDQRRAVIRTGRGMDGIIPDAYASRIIRNVMAPEFREENYDAGTINAVTALADIIDNPDNAAEILSAQANNAGASEEELSFGEFMVYYLWFGLAVSALLLLWILYKVTRTKGQSAPVKFDNLIAQRPLILAMGVFGIGIPFLMWWFIRRYINGLRNKARICPNCHTKMNRLDEVTDNLYLTAPQNTEEEIGSVDYDVWLCPECHATTIEPYVNHEANYQECQLCHTRAARLVGANVLRQPTTTREGQGVKTYHCSHCNQNSKKYYSIAKLPPVIIASGAGRGGGGGGGFSGGSFGGGITMGGGASGGW